jgi:hypothetical protein
VAVLEAQAQAKARETDVIIADNLLKTSRLRLAQLAYFRPNGTVLPRMLEPSEEGQPEGIHVDEDAALAAALAERPEILASASHGDLELDTYSTSFYLGRETLLGTGTAKMASWRKGLFAFLSRNSWNVPTYFGIPPNRVVELGSQVEI